MLRSERAIGCVLWVLRPRAPGALSQANSGPLLCKQAEAHGSFSTKSVWHRFEYPLHPLVAHIILVEEQVITRHLLNLEPMTGQVLPRVHVMALHILIVSSVVRRDEYLNMKSEESADVG